MLFNSLTFLVFLGVVLACYYRLPFRAQNWFLLAASYVFYGWWDVRFLFLLLFTSCFDYGCALWIEDQPDRAKRKWLLAFSLSLNLGVLCVFKYFNFFADSLALALGTLGLQASLPTLQVILPVGISFYTFLSMSYTIDVYRGEMKATRNPVAFLLFVAFFPHLVAGPIVRAADLLPQCAAPRAVKRDEVITGLWLILLGYVKKVVIADRLAKVADHGFPTDGSVPFTDANAWLALYAFAFQIYGDFSGYSDIARGLSKLMGFELPVNFRAPYLVTNPPEFWKHWHITLSTWLRDYLYIPLGGNRQGPARTCVNLTTTMLLGGLWHGAGAAYLIWGAYHGLLLVVHRMWTTWRRSGRREGARPHLLLRALLVAFFFHVTCVGWLFFRAGSLPGSVQFASMSRYFHALGEWPLAQGVSGLALPVLLLGALALVLQWKSEDMDRFHQWRPGWQVAAATAAVTAIAVLGVFESAQFIYFQF